jgi:hypothetical protein
LRESELRRGDELLLPRRPTLGVSFGEAIFDLSVSAHGRLPSVVYVAGDQKQRLIIRSLSS